VGSVDNEDGYNYLVPTKPALTQSFLSLSQKGLPSISIRTWYILLLNGILNTAAYEK